MACEDVACILPLPLVLLLPPPLALVKGGEVGVPAADETVEEGAEAEMEAGDPDGVEAVEDEAEAEAVVGGANRKGYA